MTKKILLALCGKSPAIITETIYALHMENPDSIPDKIIVITTTEGQKCIEDELFRNNVWNDLIASLKISRRRSIFGSSSDSIRIIPSPTGKDDASDIASSEGNMEASDFIMENLRQLTENPDTEVIFSIAGGRKTMSALGALAMSMLGRRHDRLCHVLVNHPFDNPSITPKFYYPAHNIRKYRLPDGQILKSSDASIVLCDIPFVRLRYLFQKQHMRLPGTFTDTVGLANAVIHPESQDMPELILRPESMECVIDEKKIDLNAAEFALYWLLATRCKNGLPPLRGQKTLHEEFISFSESISSSVMPEIINHNHFRNKTDDDMRKLISSLSGKIKEAMGFNSATPYYLPSRGLGVYGIALPTASIICPRNYG